MANNVEYSRNELNRIRELMVDVLIEKIELAPSFMKITAMDGQVYIWDGEALTRA